MKKLLYIFLTVLIVACSGEDSNNDGDNNNQSSCNEDNPVYLADNGVTIKACDDANVGDTGVIDGVTYTVVDEAMLRNMVGNEEDVTKAVTTKVTDMNRLFYLGTDDAGDPIYSSFNQNISSWDVSNVADMKSMFIRNTFFNQPIGNWDVSSVVDMNGMFWEAETFNQPIGDWDLSNVTDIGYMFGNCPSFNQAIGDWDVSNVTNMNGMFFVSNFNQPIGNWDVSNVTDMGGMFYVAAAFNQDLSSWSVDSVSYCNSFSYGATSWTLPKPNFTNCTP